MPGILVCHAFGGIDSLEEETCRELAKIGYIAFALDLYGKGKRGQSLEENMALLKPFREDRTNLLRRRLLCGLQNCSNWLLFWWSCALDLPRINIGIKIAVSFHGALTPLPDQPEPEKELPIQASILICHGDADTHIPQEQCTAVMAEMRARKADWQFIIYGNAKHGFTNKKLEDSPHEGVGYNEKADKRSWAAMLELFKEKFGNN
uniref:DLH domain-containing protein n=1 Tax=Meloidogyne hapla TaxID=6305 RepID=A0A1I8BXV9_MELHA